MGQGLSSRQKRLLALLVVSKRPLDLIGEAAAILGEPESRAARVSLRRAARSLERRGLVRVERSADPGGGWGKLLVSATAGAEGELTFPDLQRTRRLLAGP
jgi:hypothetical protein